MHEFELIKRIAKNVPATDDMLIKGVGDDCAVISGKGGRDLLVTTDALFDGVHFNVNWISPKTLGRKALSVNISDIAAMGGRPLYYLVSVGIPEKFPVKDVELIFDGMAQVANDFRMSLIGGDTCRSLKGFLLSLTVIGEVDHAKCVYRKGASVGDAVYVTGTFGGSALGLACLEKNMRSLETREFIKLHDDPVPRVATGAWLSASTCVSAMIDVSDGLAQDLGHIAEESGVGMTIFADKVPVPAGFEAASARCGKDRLLLALGGGEDYELAFTVRGGKIELFEKMLKVMLPTFRHEVTRIGEVTDGAGIHVVDAKGDEIPLPVKGFEHRF